MSARNSLMRVSSFAGILLALLALNIIAQQASAEDFTIIVLPDTQFYSANYPSIYTSQTQWIVDNKNALNIVYVAHVGDIVDNCYQTSQWQNAVAAMELLENPDSTELTDGIPYGLVPGNHDEPTDNYNNYFGVSRFQSRAYYGDGYPSGSNNNNYALFSAGGMDFIVINIEYLTPAAGVLQWADSLLKTHPERRAIVVSHYLINLDASWGSWGKQIYDALKANPNLFLMLCGHVHGEARRVDVYDENTVNTLLADYQGLENGGNGWLRILQFSPTKDEIGVQTYSPHLNKYDTDAASRFLLSYDMGGANTISFQDGVWPSSDYSRTRDTVLSQSAPSVNFGGDFALYVDGDDPQGSGKDLSPLLYWDISGIPQGSRVEGVSIVLNVFDTSNNTCQVYEMKRDWAEGGATWESYSAGQAWAVAGASSSQDRGTAVLGSLTPSGTGLNVINLNSEGLALVQAWVDDPATNHGFIIANAGASDGADFDSRESSTPSNRPKMTVRYSRDQSSNQQPVAAFDSDCMSLNCDFDASGAKDPDGSIVKYTWDFGDGQTAAGQKVSHSYSKEGAYSVALIVTDDEGSTDKETQAVEVLSPRMFVDSISMSGKRVGTRRSATAAITIRDTDGNAVGRASVSGAWGGAYTRNVTGTTSTTGKVSFASASVSKANATFTFTVKGVVKSKYVYDSQHNKETVDTIVVR